VATSSLIDNDGNDDGGTTYKTQNTTQTVRPNFSHGVVVECVRIHGDEIAFHRDYQAVLTGARGKTDGVDDCRQPLCVFLTSRFRFSDVEAGTSWDQQKEGICGGRGNENQKRGEEEEEKIL